MAQGRVCRLHPSGSVRSGNRTAGGPADQGDRGSLDTIPIPPENMLPNMTILTVADLLGEVILRSHEGRSVGELFNE
jgi:hypothetical protein